METNLKIEKITNDEVLACGYKPDDQWWLRRDGGKVNDCE